ncbi:hypothetical protein CROQUDRAFT_649869 [Cronartium quercuum f. sp. fusiforme G11]|uniref:Uncharacterized protein n=1 Tax=Cronartium quercuum f. sp. fusiforme G11 TaxID=708437 RepID=A0A9P6NUF1_9BASI|nr:hypothetical protein CROQUDRAFT_649869 [Cronartium quercuum f. sp. fusiforme G11]
MPSEPLVVCICATCYPLSYLDHNGVTQQGQLMTAQNKWKHSSRVMCFSLVN